MEIEKQFPDRFRKLEGAFWTTFEKACSDAKNNQSAWKKHRQLLISYSLPQYINMQDTSGETMMTLAAKYGRDHVVEILYHIKGDPSVTNSKGWTVAHVAVEYNQVNILEKLSSLSCNMDMPDSKMGYTASHLACVSNKYEILELLHNLDTNFSTKAKNGYTPLHTAANSDSVECVDLLIRIGENVNSIDNINETPAHKAARNGHSEVLSRLYKAGASLIVENIERDSVYSLAKVSGRFN